LYSIIISFILRLNFNSIFHFLVLLLSEACENSARSSRMTRCPPEFMRILDMADLKFLKWLVQNDLFNEDYPGKVCIEIACGMLREGVAELAEDHLLETDEDGIFFVCGIAWDAAAVSKTEFRAARSASRSTRRARWTLIFVKIGYAVFCKRDSARESSS
jgi:hypothetical protein